MSRLHIKTGKCCIICCDEYVEGVILHKSRRQTHGLCIECFVLYLTPKVDIILSSIKRGIIYKEMADFKCPGTVDGNHRNQCKKILSMKSYTDTNMLDPLFEKISKINIILTNSNMYVCPKCDEINQTINQTINQEPGSDKYNSHNSHETKCNYCMYSCCLKCNVSPYHNGLGCMEYESIQNNTENGKLIRSKVENGDVKFCPVCKCITEKIRGEDGKFVACNKMVCYVCNSKWCWLCQEKNIDYTHYNPSFNTACANMLWSGM